MKKANIHFLLMHRFFSIQNYLKSIRHHIIFQQAVDYIRLYFLEIVLNKASNIFRVPSTMTTFRVIYIKLSSQGHKSQGANGVSNANFPFGPK